MFNIRETNFESFASECSSLEARRTVGTPCYVYDLASLAANADTALSFPNAYGLTARFAMKASPNKAILQLFDAKVSLQMRVEGLSQRAWRL
jgi:diaminopimelate decarboxylase